LNTADTRRFIVANKQFMDTYGSKTIMFDKGERKNIGIRTQVADVSKNLMSVAMMCDCGFDVLFSNVDGNKATHRETGFVMNFDRRGNVYDLAVDVQSRPPKSSFHRRASWL